MKITTTQLLTHIYRIDSLVGWVCRPAYTGTRRTG